jgi:CRP-like cAMP-binding protein
MRSPCPSCEHLPDCLLSPLSAVELQELARQSAAIKVPARATIYSVEDPADRIYILCSGVVKLVESNSGGSNRIMAFVLPGQIFGFDALVSGREHMRTAIAREGSLVVQIERSAFASALRKSPALLWRFTGMLNFLLGNSLERQLASSGGRVRRRITATLLGCDGQLQLSQVELSELLGIPTETINREIARLHTAGLVEYKDGGIIPSALLRRSASSEP